MELETAYVAGFVDGEGNIHVGWSASGRSLNFAITLTNRHLGVLQAIQAWAGFGDLRTRADGCSSLCLTGRARVQDFLELCLPYLYVKRQQAEITLQLCRRAYTPPLSGHKPVLTLEELEGRQALVEALYAARRTQLNPSTRSEMVPHFKPPALRIGVSSERCHTAKLTLEQRLYIRNSPQTASALARELGVHPNTITSVRDGQSWQGDVDA